MDDFDYENYGMGYGAYEPKTLSQKEDKSSYPPLELPEADPVSAVLVASQPGRCAEIDPAAYEPGDDNTATYRAYYEKAPAVALTADSHRRALHPLGNLSMPAGVAAPDWRVLDTERLRHEKRSFILRTEPLFDVSSATLDLHPVPVVTTPPPGETEPAEEEPKERDPSEMPFLDHLEEFRWALLKSIAALAISMIAGWFLSDLFYTTITRLSNQSDLPLIFTKVMEPIMIKLQMALVIGLVVSLPFIFYFIWSFVAPGLYKHEKKWVLPLVFGATGSFFAGASIAYFIIIPFILQFMKAFMPEDISPMITVGNFISTLLKFTILFGVIFEMPMVTFVLAKIGLIKHTWMAKYRKYAIVSIFVLGAVLTPPDPISQIMMATPLILLYEISIVVARFAGRKTIL